jgi:hypothetical protein
VWGGVTWRRARCAESCNMEKSKMCRELYQGEEQDVQRVVTWRRARCAESCNMEKSKMCRGLIIRLRLYRSTALYIYKAKNCKLLAIFTCAQKTKFIFK